MSYASTLALMDAALESWVSNGRIGVIEVRDAMGNSTRYETLSDFIDARNKYAALAARSARTSSYDKCKFGSKT